MWLELWRVLKPCSQADPIASSSRFGCRTPYRLWFYRVIIVAKDGPSYALGIRLFLGDRRGRSQPEVPNASRSRCPLFLKVRSFQGSLELFNAGRGPKFLSNAAVLRFGERLIRTGNPCMSRSRSNRLRLLHLARQTPKPTLLPVG